MVKTILVRNATRNHPVGEERHKNRSVFEISNNQQAEVAKAGPSIWWGKFVGGRLQD